MADDQPTHVIISRKEARRLGLKSFFTGKRCPRGHITLRWVSTAACRGCTKENDAVRYARNRESEKKRMRKRYWERTRKCDLDYAKRYYKENRERLTSEARENRKENPEYWRQIRQRNWVKHRAKNMLANKRWIARNPEKRRVIKRNREARKQWNGGVHTAEDVVAILKAQRYRCAYCKKDIKNDYVMDHIVPLARGGPNDRKNMQATCSPCNAHKHAKDPLDFARSLGMLL